MKFSQMQILTFGKPVELLGKTFARNKNADKWKYVFLKEIGGRAEITVARYTGSMTCWYIENGVTIVSFNPKTTDNVEESIKKALEAKNAETKPE